MSETPSSFRLPHLVVPLLAVAAVVGGTMMTRAADHLDAPDTSENNLDLADLYVFNVGDDVVFAMTVAPLLSPGEETQNAALNPEGLYQLNLDVERDGIAEAVIQVTAEGTGTGQTVQVRGPAAPTMTGTTMELLEVEPATGAFDQTFESGEMSVFAGPRDDPFFINLLGDMSLTSVLNAVYGQALGQQIGADDEQTLAFEDPGMDDLAGTNVIGIVIQLPKAQIAEALGIGDSDTFYAWASTGAMN